jgi:plasmid maintenance system antidote protein VapI
VRDLNAPARAGRILSRRALEQLNSLQASVQALGTTRNKALRIFVASRNVTTQVAQREFWLEFSWADQEYRVAVRRLAEFCGEHAARGSQAGRP